MAELTQRALPAPPPAAAPWVRAGAALEHTRERLADPVARPALLWQALWWPFLIWSETPAPALPRKSVPVPADIGLAGAAVVTGIDRVRRRLWVTHAAAALCRAIWLSVMFAALLMLLDVLGGPTFNPRLPLAVGVPLLLAGLALAVLSRPSRMATAQMLDRTFGLQERLGTALDDLGLGVPEPGEHAPVVYLQMADAANAIAALRPHPGHARLSARVERRTARARRYPRAPLHPGDRTIGGAGTVGGRGGRG